MDSMVAMRVDDFSVETIRRWQAVVRGHQGQVRAFQAAYVASLRDIRDQWRADPGRRWGRKALFRHVRVLAARHVVGPDGMSESAFIDHCRIAQNCVRYNVPWAVARHRNFILERADAAMKAEGGEITESRWREKVESVSREEAAQREVAGDLGGRPAAVDPEAILQRALQVIHHELARPEVKTALKAKSRISRAIMAIAHHVETVLVSELAQGPSR
jgi:hypothetical protein